MYLSLNNSFKRLIQNTDSSSNETDSSSNETSSLNLESLNHLIYKFHEIFCCLIFLTITSI